MSRLNPGKIRQRLGLSRGELARCLNISERTVMRWEEDGADPGGIATAVLRAISDTLDTGADLPHARRVLGLGITELVRRALTNYRSV